MYTLFIIYIKECGNTSKFVTNITVRGNMVHCSNAAPCYCHDRICLHGGKCSSGNVYLDGKPFCGFPSWRTKNPLIPERIYEGHMICNDLGFPTVAGTSRGKFGHADTANGWWYQSRLCARNNNSAPDDKKFSSCINDTNNIITHEGADFCRQEEAQGVTCIGTLERLFQQKKNIFCLFQH